MYYKLCVTDALRVTDEPCLMVLSIFFILSHIYSIIYVMNIVTNIMDKSC